ncbi:MAG: rod shape-determining protein, partial [Methanoregula sp.]|nr:rod shape-determining protein [Methanoregula sp.]
MVDRYIQSDQPHTRLGVDFGTGVLVIGIEGPGRRGFRTLEFPGWSKAMPGGGDLGIVHGVPVLIHYDQDGSWTIGNEVMHADCSDHPATARWIRKYLLDESMVRIPSGPGRQVTFRDAATDFLKNILARAKRECPGHPEVVFSIPHNAPEWYTGWLGSIAHTTGLASGQMINEHTATAVGYGLSINEGQTFLIIRFDEMDISVSVILHEGSSGHSGELRVAGRSSEDMGCRALDSWIAQDMLTG